MQRKRENLRSIEDIDNYFEKNLNIDKQKFLANLLESTKMNKLSSEILRISEFAKRLYMSEKNENVIN